MFKRNSTMSQIIVMLMVILTALVDTDAQSGATVTRARLLFTHQTQPVKEHLVKVDNHWPPFLGQRLRLNLVDNYQLTGEQFQRLRVREQTKQEQQQQLPRQQQHQEAQPQLQQQQQQEHQQQLQPHQFLLKEIQQNKNNRHSLFDQNRALSQSNRIQKTLESPLVQLPLNSAHEQQRNHKNSHTQQQIQQPKPRLLSQEIQPKMPSQNLNVQHTTQNILQHEPNNGFQQQHPNNGFQQQHPNQQLNQGIHQTFIPQLHQFVKQEQSQGDVSSNLNVIEEPKLEFQGQFSQTPFQNNQVLSGQQQSDISKHQLVFKTQIQPNDVQLESHFPQQSNFEDDPFIKHLSSEIQLLDQQIFDLSQRSPQQGQGLLVPGLFGQQSGQTIPFMQNQNSQSHQQSSQLLDKPLPNIPQSSNSQVNSQPFASNFDKSAFNHAFAQQSPQFTTHLTGSQGFNPQHISVDLLNINQQQFDPQFNQQTFGMSQQVSQQTPINEIHRVDDLPQSEQFDHEALLHVSHQPQQQLLQLQPTKEENNPQQQLHQPQQQLSQVQPTKEENQSQQQLHQLLQQLQLWQTKGENQPQQQLHQHQQQLIQVQPSKEENQPQQQLHEPQQQLQLQPAKEVNQPQNQLPIQQPEQHKTDSKCRRPCQKILNIVCGSDGVSYTNPCELRNSICLNKDLFQVHTGHCGRPAANELRRGKSLFSTPAKGNEVPPSILAVFAAAGPPSKQGIQ